MVEGEHSWKMHVWNAVSVEYLKIKLWIWWLLHYNPSSNFLESTFSLQEEEEKEEEQLARLKDEAASQQDIAL